MWLYQVNDRRNFKVYISDNDLNIALLRYFNPIGAYESGRMGEDPNGIPNNLMPYITQVAAGKRDELSIFGNDYDTHNGTGVKDYIHIVDLAKGHLKVLEKIMFTKGIDAYNLGTGVGYSVLDVVKKFEKAIGQKIPYVITERRPGDIDKCYADPTKAYKELGWKAEKILKICVGTHGIGRKIIRMDTKDNLQWTIRNSESSSSFHMYLLTLGKF